MQRNSVLRLQVIRRCFIRNQSNWSRPPHWNVSSSTTAKFEAPSTHLTWKVNSDSQDDDPTENGAGIDSEQVIPQYILLVRHGQSQGNMDERMFETVPDWKIPLSEHGRKQARAAGMRIKQLVRDGNPILFYTSPYLRTKQTLQELQSQLSPSHPTLFTREEPRLREQDFGNFQDYHQIQKAKADRPKFGRFFYRFPNGGESGADVYDRVSAFSTMFWQDMEQLSRLASPNQEQMTRNSTAVLVTHGITSRLLVMKWLHWSVDDFEVLHNPPNCGLLVLQRTSQNGRHYRLTEESRALINGPDKGDGNNDGPGKALQLGDWLTANRRKARSIPRRKARDAFVFDSMPHSAWGI